MSRHRITAFVRTTRTMAMSVLIVAGVTLSACGPLGDDDSDPTLTAETVEQPVNSSTEESAAAPEETQVASEPTTGAVDDGTPVSETGVPSTPKPFDRGMPVADDETEATTEVVSVSTPVLDLDDDSDAGTPVTDESEPAATPSGTDEPTDGPTEEASDDEGSTSSFGGSDGTSGATPEGETDESTAGQNGEATPFFVPDDATPTPTPGEATPVPDGTPAGDGTPVAPEDATIADVSPVMVTSCEPEGVPEITIDQVDYLTADDVNFRTGPGAECDLINTIGINAEVTLLGGPVTREEDDFVWVQVEIAGQTGWIVIDVLEPVG